MEGWIEKDGELLPEIPTGARQVEWYGRNYPGLAEKVAAQTTADELEAGKLYPVHIINEHIPRGASIEYLCGIDSGSLD